MTALPNQRHEAFAQLLAKGSSATEAYKAIYGADVKNPGDCACRLSAKVRKRVIQIQSQAKRNTLLTMQRRREICLEIANNKKAKAGDRLRAAELDAKFTGEMLEKVDMTTGGEPLPTAMPQISIELPPSFISRRGVTQQN